GRVDTIRQWDGKTQERLYEAAKGFLPLTLEHFVPSDREPLQEVIHWGKNSLPALTHFQKRFCKPGGPRPTGASGGEEPPEWGDMLWGYNHNDGLSKFAGPGFFCVHPDEAEGEIGIDYTKLPPSKPEKWPAIQPNSSGISRLVYYDMVDVMRGISTHV